MEFHSSTEPSSTESGPQEPAPLGPTQADAPTSHQLRRLEDRASDRLRGRTAAGHERRRAHRQPVSAEATVSFLTRPLTLGGHLENLSRTGARFRAAGALPEGSLHPVELVFTLAGYSFRQTGVVRWNREGCLGVQFAPMSYLRSRELDEALILAARRDADGASVRNLEAVTMDGLADKPAGPGHPKLNQSEPDQPRSNPPGPREHEPAGASPIEPTQTITPPETKPLARERRAHARLATAMTAAIYLVHSSIRYNGEVENLSLGGCLVRLERRVALSLFTRVEVSFFHQGMPFRVAGVIQVLHGGERVGIRFLDISTRTATKLGELLEELADTSSQPSKS